MVPVLNERQYVELFLNSENDVQNDLWSYVSPLAKYYWEKGYDLEQNISAICDVLSKHYEGFNPELYIDRIKTICDTVKGRELSEVKYIPITAKELSIIDRAGNLKNRLMLFTCLCYAKYNDIKSSNNNGWVNIERYVLGAIGKSATLSLSNNDLRTILGELSRSGYLNRPAGADGKVVGRGVSNTNHQIAFLENDESPVLVMVKQLDNAGAYYRQYCGQKYIECQRCGKLVKQNRNVQKYCKQCSLKIKNSQNLLYYYSKKV